jgi:hypothetical protein
MIIFLIIPFIVASSTFSTILLMRREGIKTLDWKTTALCIFGAPAMVFGALAFAIAGTQFLLMVYD